MIINELIPIREQLDRIEKKIDEATGSNSSLKKEKDKRPQKHLSLFCAIHLTQRLKEEEEKNSRRRRGEEEKKLLVFLLYIPYYKNINICVK